MVLWGAVLPGRASKAEDWDRRDRSMGVFDCRTMSLKKGKQAVVPHLLPLKPGRVVCDWGVMGSSWGVVSPQVFRPFCVYIYVIFKKVKEERRGLGEVGE